MVFARQDAICADSAQSVALSGAWLRPLAKRLRAQEGHGIERWGDGSVFTGGFSAGRPPSLARRAGGTHTHTYMKLFKLFSTKSLKTPDLVVHEQLLPE